jgi:hypothetical protein
MNVPTAAVVVVAGVEHPPEVVLAQLRHRVLRLVPVVADRPLLQPVHGLGA